MQYIALITLCSAAILLAIQTPIVASDLGRLLLVAAITSMVVCSPVADSTLIIDRLLSAVIGGSALYYLVGVALGPVPYRVLVNPPRALIDVRRGAYRMESRTIFA
jgi:hypothetical protein